MRRRDVLMASAAMGLLPLVRDLPVRLTNTHRTAPLGTGARAASSRLLRLTAAGISC